jgi:hypothetical protein
MQGVHVKYNPVLLRHKQLPRRRRRKEDEKRRGRLFPQQNAAKFKE